MAGRLNSCSHSESVFIKHFDGSDMRPCEEREKLRPVIEHGGGKITSKCLQGSIKSTNSKGTEGRKMYTLEDDMAMLTYIVTEVKYNSTGGYQTFRDMQVEKVTEHSYMSMHTRFRKQILPNIDKYDIPNHWKYLVTGDFKYNKHQQSLDALFKSTAEINVDDSEDDESFITCEDEFDRHLLEKLETSNNKSGKGSDLKTQNTRMEDFRRKNANNLNHGSNEQTGNDSKSNKGKSPVKRKSDSVEQLESSDEESVKINKWRKFAPSKQKKISADAFMSEDSSAESETDDDQNSKDAKSSNIKSRKPQRGKSGGGQNRFVDYSSMDSEIVEDSVEEEEEDEVVQEVTASRSGRGKKRSAQNLPPYLEQILDTDVESQTDLSP